MFQPFKQWAEQDTESYVIKKSTTLAIGDAVQFDVLPGNNYLVGAGGTTSGVYGIVVGFVATGPGTNQGTLTANSIATSATNQTTEMVRARVLPVRQSRLFLADLSQTAGTTTGSGDPGFFNVASQNGNLSETSYVTQTAAALQFFSTGSGLATSAQGPFGLFPATATQVIGFFSNSKTA